MWNLIPRKHLPPTRIARYCCEYLKENSDRHRMIATGVRWDESRNRKDRAVFETSSHKKQNATHVSDEKMLLSDNDDKRKLFEQCELRAKTVVNPIIDWSDKDIIDFFRNECKTHNPLYDMGYYRIGCIGCPMGGGETMERVFGFSYFQNNVDTCF